MCAAEASGKSDTMALRVVAWPDANVHVSELKHRRQDTAAMPYYLVEPWGRDKYRQASLLSTAGTVQEVYAELDRMVARLVAPLSKTRS